MAPPVFISTSLQLHPRFSQLITFTSEQQQDSGMDGDGGGLIVYGYRGMPKTKNLTEG